MNKEEYGKLQPGNKIIWTGELTGKQEIHTVVKTRTGKIETIELQEEAKKQNIYDGYYFMYWQVERYSEAEERKKLQKTIEKFTTKIIDGLRSEELEEK